MNCSFLFDGVDGGFFRYVDAIQKLPDIFVLGTNTLVYESSRIGDQFNVISFNNYLVLLSRLLANHSVSHFHNTDVPFTKIVANFHCLSSVNDVQVDGKMCVHRSHFVKKSILNSFDQVLDVTADGSQASQLFTQSKPDIHTDGGFVYPGQLQVEMVEASFQHSTTTLHSDGATIHLHINSIGNGDSLTG